MLWRRWIVLGLALILTTVGAWAFMEFVVWNQLPSELVGRWEVVESDGPEYREAVFEFHRNGRMIAHINQNGQLGIINAEVRVEADKIYSTTRQPRTGKEKVTVQTIRSLTRQELVVADDAGKATRMARIN